MGGSAASDSADSCSQWASSSSTSCLGLLHPLHARVWHCQLRKSQTLHVQPSRSWVAVCFLKAAERAARLFDRFFFLFPPPPIVERKDGAEQRVSG